MSRPKRVAPRQNLLGPPGRPAEGSGETVTELVQADSRDGSQSGLRPARLSAARASRRWGG
jgi:hypothetical protein